MRKDLEFKGFDGIYEIDDCGNVYQKRRRPHSPFKDNDFPRRIATRHDKDGYVCVTLINDGNCFTFRVHKLVAITFIPNPENKPQINHKDGNKENNSVSNLEWCTQRENNLHALNTKLRVMKNNKLSKEVLQYDLDGNLIKIYPSANEAKRQTGYSQSHISECCRGDKLKTYKGFIWKYQ